MMFVTRAVPPPRDMFLHLIDEILESRTFTNHGTLVVRFERALQNFIHAPALLSCANGTLGLQLALRALGLSGKKVITTPFSYVATVSALLAEKCTPVFADIDPESLCLSPEAAAACCTPDVAGLLPVHVYGNACPVEALAELARDKNVRILYDAAHAMGAEYQGKSLLLYGDAAVCSFHATKIIHSCEGGCVICHDDETSQRIALSRAFGHVGDEHIMPGLNAKMSELHAAMGLCQLPLLAENIRARSVLTAIYDQGLSTSLRRPKFREKNLWNHAYYPVIFENEATLLRVQIALNAQGIFPRRYFFPALNTLPYLHDSLRTSCPVAEDVSRRVLCLPLYADLQQDDVLRVISSVNGSL